MSGSDRLYTAHWFTKGICTSVDFSVWSLQKSELWDGKELHCTAWPLKCSGCEGGDGAARHHVGFCSTAGKGSPYLRRMHPALINL